jgi:hypothetical protein
MVAFLCGEFRGEGAESVLEMQRGFTAATTHRVSRDFASIDQAPRILSHRLTDRGAVLGFRSFVV